VFCVHILSHCFAKAYLRLGAIIGQLFVGLVCDRIGRKAALVFTTLLIVLGATLGTAAHGAHSSAKGLFWFMTFARGLTGIVRTGGIGYVLLTSYRLLLGCWW
jgi:MFS family permease